MIVEVQEELLYYESLKTCLAESRKAGKQLRLYGQDLDSRGIHFIYVVLEPQPSSR